MATRLPIPGSDDGQWGSILNGFLSVEHNSNGTLKKASAITQASTDATTAKNNAATALSTANSKYSKPTGGIPASDLTSAVQTSLGKADSALQTAPVSSVNTQTGAVTLTAADLGALTQSTGDGRYLLASSKGANNGVASLDGGGKLPTNQLPVGVSTLKVSQSGTIAGTQPQLNFIPGSNVSLVTANDSANNKVDITINSTTGGGSSTLSGNTDVDITTPSNGDVLTYNTTDAMWENLPAPAASVTSVNSQTGDVTLTASDVGLGNVSNTSDANKPLSSAATTALNGKVPTTRAIITTGGSLTGGGDLTADRTIALSGDSATPGNSKYYGTNGSGTKGYFSLPTGGSDSRTFATKTTSYTASNGDFLFVDSTSGLVTVTLPAPVASGKVSVKRVNPAGNGIQVAAPGGSYIDAASGVGTVTINSQFQSQDFLSDGSNWFRV